MADLKIQGVVEVSTEGAEGALNRVGTTAEGMARKVEGAATQAGKAVDNIGSGAGRSADEFTRAEGKIVASIKRATTQLEQMGKTASQKLEMRIQTQGLDAAKFEPMLAKLRDLERAQDSLGNSATRLPSAYDEITRSLGGLVSAAAALAAVGGSMSKLVEVQRQFDVINASLVTMTGSAANAKVAFSAIQQFAATTPFSLQEVAGAFVKLKSLGLDPSQRALESFGNTASAMGKSLDQFIEAVADASTGEFERLKEFGIKAKQESGNVELTFRGTATTVKNSAAEITEYLTKIGEVEFAGAMAERAKTLDGAISNLADSWDGLFLTVSQNNAGGLIFDTVKLASGAVDDLTKIIRAMSSAADENARATGAMAVIQEGIGKTFETVAVVGANVSYVFKTIGAEIGGLAAQAAALLRGDFAGSKFIGEEMKRDATVARAEVDALSERILGARTAAAAAAKSLDDLVKDRAPSKPPVDTAALKTAKKDADELKALLDTINAKSSGFDSSYVKNVELLLKAYGAGKLTLEEYNAAFSTYVAMQPGAVAAERERVKLLKEQEEAQQKYMTGMGDETAMLIEKARASEQELLLIGASAERVAELTALRYDEQIAMKAAEAERLRGAEGREAELFLLEQQIDALQRLKAAETAKPKLQAQAREWENFSRDINRSLTDALLRGFESGKDFARNLRDTVVNMFQTMVLRPVISATLSPVTGAVAGAIGLGGAASNAYATGQAPAGIGSWLNAGSSASSAYSAFSGGFSPAYASFATSGIGQSLGLSTAQSAGYMAPVYGPGGQLVSAGTGSSAGGLTTTGQSLGTGLSYVGAGLAGITVGSLIAQDKVVLGLNSTAASTIGAVIGGAIDGPLGAFIGGAAGGIFNAAFGMGAKEYGDTRLAGRFRESGFSGSWATSWQQDGGVFRSDKSGTDYQALTKTQDQGFDALFAGARSVFDELIKSTGDAQRSLKGWSFSVDRVVQTEAQQKKLIEDLADSLGKTLAPELIALKAEGETLADTAVRMRDEFALTSKIAGVLGKDVETAFGKVGMASLEMRDTLIKLMGGIESATTLTQAYYEGYFSAEEKLANDKAALAAKFQELDLTMPGTRAEFRALVESMDLATTSGQAMFATLISMSTQFGAVADAASASAAQMAAVSATSSADYAIRVARGSVAVPGFAAGGDFSGGLRLVGESGPEIEATGPARIWSAAQTAQMLSGGSESVVGEIRALRSENAAQARSIAQLQARMTKLLERWDGAGMPETRIAA